MTKELQAIRNDMGQLAEDARALMTATSGATGDKIAEARSRLSAGLDQVRERAARRIKAADNAVRRNAYQGIAIGIGVGALLGFLAARSCAGKRDQSE